MTQSRLPQPGEIYRHFKNKLYQIITIASHSETNEPLVIYQALYGSFSTYARPLEMFLSEVDHQKYPEVTQPYRFVLVPPSELTASTTNFCASAALSKIAEDTPTISPKKPSAFTRSSTDYLEVSPVLMKFLEAETYHQKIQILQSMAQNPDDKILTAIAVSLDLALNDGSADEHFSSVMKSLQTLCKYEFSRNR